MAGKLGVDVGGTFTDVIYHDDDGSVKIGKQPTTADAPHKGIIDAVEATQLTGGQLGDARYFLHGTTVGLNALLTGTGAVVGLLTTRGFRDVLEIRRGDRDNPYDLFPAPVSPLVPRRRRVAITERMYADGSVHTPIDEAEVEQALDGFSEDAVTSIAVAFLHAYANPAHELAAESALRAAGFTGSISLSHQVSGEYREYERTTTTVVDAYVRPKMSDYLVELEGSVSELGFAGEFFVTRSGGGALTFGEARRRPFETIISGPVGGAEGAARLAGQLGLTEVITADVGGTSFDTCLISGGRPTTLYEGRVVGLPLQSPWVDVRSIGAGGGSIASIDRGGLLRVGPESAGANPGPVCYRRGGVRPTVTDAAVVLGMLGQGVLANGLQLDRDAAMAAFVPLAEALGFDPSEVARGVITIATAHMADAIREITVEQGQDPRTAALMAFGGAGPMFATILARELEIGEIVIPAHAGNFSAWGLLGADIRQSAARTLIYRVDVAAIGTTNGVLDELFAELATRASASGRTAATQREVALDMRYAGQEHTITVAVPTVEGRLAATADDVRGRFVAEYERTFAHTMDEEVEVVSVRAETSVALAAAGRSAAQPSPVPRAFAPAADPRSVDAYSFAAADWRSFPTVDRSALSPDTPIIGPTLILEETTTTYVDVGFTGQVHSSGALMITSGAAE